MKKYISIDIGGTAIKYGIICENAEIMMKETMKTEAEKGGSAILEKVFVIVENYKDEFRKKLLEFAFQRQEWLIQNKVLFFIRHH